MLLPTANVVDVTEHRGSGAEAGDGPWRRLSAAILVVLLVASGGLFTPLAAGADDTAGSSIPLVEFAPIFANSTISDGGPPERSANGCNEDVCIYVAGERGRVDSWVTTVYVPPEARTCPDASFWFREPGKTRQRYDFIRNDACDVWYDQDATIIGWWARTDLPPDLFVDKTQLCNSWSIYPGYPCITIKYTGIKLGPIEI